MSKHELTIISPIFAAVVIVTALATAVYASSRKDCAIMSPQAAKLVVPILDAMTEATQDSRSMEEKQGTPFWRVGVLVGKLIANKSSASDEALVVLLYYYNGEANGEDQLREITIRGKRMLPYLYRYQNHCPQLPGRQFSNLLLPRKTVEADFEAAITFIKKSQFIE